MGERELRSEILDTARAMNARGINHGASGNVSARTARAFLVTPSGKDYGECVPEDVVAMTMEGEVQGDGRPSSEWRIHRDLLGPPGPRSTLSSTLILRSPRRWPAWAGLSPPFTTW